MFRRALHLSKNPTESFFRWGPRQAGESSLLGASYPNATWVDLLRTDDFLRYQARPALFREELLDAPRGHLVVIDEIQKVPALLDEVHGLIENRGLRFALCESSARFAKRLWLGDLLAT